MFLQFCHHIGVIEVSESCHQMILFFVFVPPQYYGDKCQYHNRRLSVLFHLNLSQSNYINQTTNINLVLKLLLRFFYENQILMTHEFHIQPQLLDTLTIQKKIIHFRLLSFISICSTTKRSNFESFKSSSFSSVFNSN